MDGHWRRSYKMLQTQFLPPPPPSPLLPAPPVFIFLFFTKHWYSIMSSSLHPSRIWKRPLFLFLLLAFCFFFYSPVTVFALCRAAWVGRMPTAQVWGCRGSTMSQLIRSLTPWRDSGSLITVKELITDVSVDFCRVQISNTKLNKQQEGFDVLVDVQLNLRTRPILFELMFHLLSGNNTRLYWSVLTNVSLVKNNSFMLTSNTAHVFGSIVINVRSRPSLQEVGCTCPPASGLHFIPLISAASHIIYPWLSFHPAQPCTSFYLPGRAK